ncbi:uncharacterized protein MONOS_2715 [Monocercomonoides exilis]|uniref:uncharacterized protein n=1 Tax=Monocercomonoides exilis TaxID=2049356 RepID=UPI00355A9E5F|nr:hypothetical protein MONOS_2715 [Monocercomonoides exilis]|eukprot:MONOS_2715.1-p1 / transcript=MONOS_2715.1 / gene=MONOS_2715 / organism=Monocercomonoides_exilis_PA203 / gene_product=unspecified product / transcript_product=unspecified product / location=Mono_scaffold00057:80369-84701(-) / protein_length=1424 / sequence_SO=supercontig / SO=protein_coding / is_pseudo=false
MYESLASSRMQGHRHLSVEEFAVIQNEVMIWKWMKAISANPIDISIDQFHFPPLNHLPHQARLHYIHTSCDIVRKLDLILNWMEQMYAETASFAEAEVDQDEQLSHSLYVLLRSGQSRLKMVECCIAAGQNWRGATLCGDRIVEQSPSTTDISQESEIPESCYTDDSFFTTNLEAFSKKCFDLAFAINKLPVSDNAAEDTCFLQCVEASCSSNEEDKEEHCQKDSSFINGEAKIFEPFGLPHAKLENEIALYSLLSRHLSLASPVLRTFADGVWAFLRVLMWRIEDWILTKGTGTRKAEEEENSERSNKMEEEIEGKGRQGNKELYKNKPFNQDGNSKTRKGEWTSWEEADATLDSDVSGWWDGDSTESDKADTAEGEQLSSANDEFVDEGTKIMEGRRCLSDASSSPLVDLEATELASEEEHTVWGFLSSSLASGMLPSFNEIMIRAFVYSLSLRCGLSQKEIDEWTAKWLEDAPETQIVEEDAQIKQKEIRISQLSSRSSPSLSNKKIQRTIYSPMYLTAFTDYAESVISVRNEEAMSDPSGRSSASLEPHVGSFNRLLMALMLNDRLLIEDALKIERWSQVAIPCNLQLLLSQNSSTDCHEGMCSSKITKTHLASFEQNEYFDTNKNANEFNPSSFQKFLRGIVPLPQLQSEPSPLPSLLSTSLSLLRFALHFALSLSGEQCPTPASVDVVSLNYGYCTLLSSSLLHLCLSCSAIAEILHPKCLNANPSDSSSGPDDTTLSPLKQLIRLIVFYSSLLPQQLGMFSVSRFFSSLPLSPCSATQQRRFLAQRKQAMKITTLGDDDLFQNLSMADLQFAMHSCADENINTSAVAFWTIRMIISREMGQWDESFDVGETTDRLFKNSDLKDAIGNSLCSGIFKEKSQMRSSGSPLPFNQKRLLTLTSLATCVDALQWASALPSTLDILLIEANHVARLMLGLEFVEKAVLIEDGICESGSIIFGANDTSDEPISYLDLVKEIYSRMVPPSILEAVEREHLQMGEKVAQIVDEQAEFWNDGKAKQLKGKENETETDMDIPSPLSSPVQEMERLSLTPSSPSTERIPKQHHPHSSMYLRSRIRPDMYPVVIGNGFTAIDVFADEPATSSELKVGFVVGHHAITEARSIRWLVHLIDTHAKYLQAEKDYRNLCSLSVKRIDAAFSKEGKDLFEKYSAILHPADDILQPAAHFIAMLTEIQQAARLSPQSVSVKDLTQILLDDEACQQIFEQLLKAEDDVKTASAELMKGIVQVLKIEDGGLLGECSRWIKVIEYEHPPKDVDDLSYSKSSFNSSNSNLFIIHDHQIARRETITAIRSVVIPQLLSLLHHISFKTRSLFTDRILQEQGTSSTSTETDERKVTSTNQEIAQKEHEWLSLSNVLPLLMVSKSEDAAWRIMTKKECEKVIEMCGKESELALKEKEEQIVHK